MSLSYYFLLPILFSFLTPLFKKFGTFGIRGSSVLLNAILFIQALVYTKTSLPQIAQFSVAPPLGIAFVLDNFSLLFLLIFTFSGFIVSIYMWQYFKENDAKNETKFYVLFNMLISGSIGMVLSCDIFNIYIFFEIVGISSYTLAAYNRDKKALEAGIKYLIIGSVASIFIVFAIMLIYLQIGTLNIAQIAQRYSEINPQVGTLIALMLFIGFGTKAELFPLNFWVPDVYQGSS
jgi:formate hydrogenlyase subunit 3/multisubunit Na+/H+ antiporter MnhD subunit